MLTWFSIHNFLQRFANQRRTFGDCDSGGLECRNLIRRGSFSTRNDGSGMAHAPARRRRPSRDKAYDRLLHMGLHKGRSFLFCQPADFANHHDAVRIRVVIEQAQRVHETRLMELASKYGSH